MRLVKQVSSGGFWLTDDLRNNVPQYAILSHTWTVDTEEVSFMELMGGRGWSKSAYNKMRFCAKQAERDGIEYFWIGTCCIDKNSSIELSEAINSVFGWYRNAKKCYVYLSDVSVSTSGTGEKSMSQPWESAFRNSRWFTRGWTLPELIAPMSVEFFSAEGERLGDKRSLEQQIHETTGIPIKALRGAPLSQFSVAERASWSENRSTTREEDNAYCLFGIFDIQMPIIYGEGKQKALKRLQGEIDKLSLTHQPVFFDSTGQPESPDISTPRIVPVESIPSTTVSYSELVPPAGGFSTNELLYSHTLAILRFRIFILEPGTMGSSIIGHIHESSLLDPPTYYALSYVWGQEPAIHQIVINGRAKLVQPNLFHALQRIRLPRGPIHIWIDSICINQVDDSERNMQVRQMATIYSKASGVLVWIGEENSTSNLALEFISQIISSDFKWDGSWWEQYGFIALAQILERPWFRRVWVIQEAAFSANSTICCGDRQVYMDHFAMAVDLIRARLSTMPPAFGHRASIMPITILANFHDSPAVRLLDTIEGAFQKSADGDILHRRMSLELLVGLSTYSEMSDQRDTIYALLNLANDITSSLQPDQSDAIIPDYGKNILDVFVDFILHCSRHSVSLDIICRPWAPISSSTVHGIRQGNPLGDHSREYPSWIISRDYLPFGNPSWRLNHRLHGNFLVGVSQKRAYNTHNGSIPFVSVGRDKDGTCNGSLHARGIILGQVAQRSTRLASAIITKECLEILGTISHKPHSNLINLPDTIWRTLCADRDEKGEPAPRFYRLAMLHLLQISSETPKEGEATNLLDSMSSIDVEELLDTPISEHVRTFLTVIRDVIWNRRTFRSKENDGNERPLVGLIPQKAKIGDHICILYGCSVPVILRKLPRSNDEFCWQLIGDAYVHGIMDGEAMRSVPPDALESRDVAFEIR